ncbi:peptidase M20, partial [Bacillus safensis]|nr:peptidase M20 [Bacillus safensis]
AFTRNFPGWGIAGAIPFREIRELNIPSINIGVYGKDGHKWTERVYKPYSFGVLPKLIQETTVQMLKSKHACSNHI